MFGLQNRIIKGRPTARLYACTCRLCLAALKHDVRLEFGGLNIASHMHDQWYWKLPAGLRYGALNLALQGRVFQLSTGTLALLILPQRPVDLLNDA